MAEIAVGVAFALWFIILFFLISKLFGSSKRKHLSVAVALAPLDTARVLGTNRPKLFLTTREMSEHHAGGTRGSSAEHGR